MRFLPDFQHALAAAHSALHHFERATLADAELRRNPLDYYLLATYPPLKAMAPIEPEEVFRNPGTVHRAYVHIPFCEQYCTFCHYAKEINPREHLVKRYLTALHREIELTAARLGQPVPVKSVYFGGGTPSYLTAAELAALMEQLFANVRLADGGELMFELHPGIVRRSDYADRIGTLQSAGISRWVFGIQSMDEQVLKKLNRGHGQEEVFALLDILDRHGCRDVSVDLIFGCPYQTLDNWYESLRVLIQAGVDKFNVFPLMFKLTDPIALHYQREPEIFPTASDRLLMHFMAEHIFAEHGYAKGPIQYYSRGPHAYAPLGSRESCNIADAMGLIPFGVSAFGYIGHSQYYNHCTMNEYLDALTRDRPPVWMGVTLSPDERMRRTVMLGLRSRGILVSEFMERFGVDPWEHFADKFRRLESAGLVVRHDDLIQLTSHGAVDAAGAATLFCSPDVRRRIRDTNSRLENRKKNPLEQFDFSPIEHIGVRRTADQQTGRR